MMSFLLSPPNSTRLAAAAIVCGCLSGVAHAGTYTDNFNSGINGSMWTIQTDGSATVAAANNRVEMTLGNTINGARLVLNTAIFGNFDASVDYTLLNWPAQSEAGISLGTGFVDLLASDLPLGLSGYVGGGRLSYSGGEAYSSDLVTSGHQVYLSPTSDMSGKLRITKVGGDVGVYDWNGADWSPIHLYPNAQRDSTINVIELALFRVPLPGVKVAFDNFSITAPATALPAPEPETWAMLVVGIGLVGLRLRGREKSRRGLA